MAGSTQFGTSMKDSNNRTKGQLRDAHNTKKSNFLDQSVDYSQAQDVRNQVRSPYVDQDRARDSRYRSTTIEHNVNLKDTLTNDYSHRSQTINSRDPKNNVEDKGYNVRQLAQHAKLIKMRQRIPKIKVMRSSMFTKNPILDKRDADMNSNYSAGRFSSFTRQPG